MKKGRDLAVIGQDGKIVFVRHGGVLIRVHVTQQKFNGEPELESRINVDSEGDDNIAVPQQQRTLVSHLMNLCPWPRT